MKQSVLLLLAIAASATVVAEAQSPAFCADLSGLSLDRVEITKADVVPTGFTVPPPYPGAPSVGPLPAHCRVDGVINRRRGIDGQEFGIGFALALPDKAAWRAISFVLATADCHGDVQRRGRDLLPDSHPRRPRS